MYKGRSWLPAFSSIVSTSVCIGVDIFKILIWVSFQFVSSSVPSNASFLFTELVMVYDSYRTASDF